MHSSRSIWAELEIVKNGYKRLKMVSGLTGLLTLTMYLMTLVLTPEVCEKDTQSDQTTHHAEHADCGTASVRDT